ncbi:hypothetical protein ES702_06129 [subsurface metagenome]
MFSHSQHNILLPDCRAKPRTPAAETFLSPNRASLLLCCFNLPPFHHPWKEQWTAVIDLTIKESQKPGATWRMLMAPTNNAHL